MPGDVVTGQVMKGQQSESPQNKINRYIHFQLSSNTPVAVCVN